VRVPVSLAIVAALAAPASAGPRAKPARPTVTIGAIETAGPLTATGLEPVIRAEKADLRACHIDRQKTRRGLLGGEVAATFTVLADGTIDGAVASGIDGELAACVARVLGAIDPPAADAPTTVTVAVRYRVPLDRVVDGVREMVRVPDPSRYGGPGWELDHLMREQTRSASPSESLVAGSGSFGPTGMAALGRLAVTVDDPAPPLAVAAGIVAAHRGALDGCFADYARDASFVLAIDTAGAVTGVELPRDADTLAATCVRGAAAAMRFPAGAEDSRLSVSLELGGDRRVTVAPTTHLEP
jgi:hypothetical protein